jgi:hypothetical protein
MLRDLTRRTAHLYQNTALMGEHWVKYFSGLLFRDRTSNENPPPSSLDQLPELPNMALNASQSTPRDTQHPHIPRPDTKFGAL